MFGVKFSVATVVIIHRQQLTHHSMPVDFGPNLAKIKISGTTNVIEIGRSGECLTGI